MSKQFDFGALDAPFERDWPVTVPVPLDGGATDPQTFMARFRLLSSTETDAVWTEPDMGPKSFARHYFIGFGKGEAQEFNEAIRERMLDFAHVRMALDKAYNEFAQGIAAKN